MSPGSGIIATVRPRILLIIPVIIACTTCLFLFFARDHHIDVLWSDCSDVGGPSAIQQSLCFLAALFAACTASSVGLAIMASFFSFTSALLLISYVEAARIANRPSRVLRNPVAPWILTNAVSGAIVIPLIMLPATMPRSRNASSAGPATSGESVALLAGGNAAFDPDRGKFRRHVTSAADACAVPLAVALGFVAPSAVLLLRPSPLIVGIWNFFPLYVALLRTMVRGLVGWRCPESLREPCHIEDSVALCAFVYSLPATLSFCSHVAVVYQVLFGHAVTGPLSHSVLLFMKADFLAMLITMQYWLLVEAGWRVAVNAVLVTVLIGPGAGLIFGWILKERILARKINS